MAANKTQPTDASVDDFIESIGDEGVRTDVTDLRALMSEVTGEDPVMWGDAIVGFGRYRYRYASGREGEWFLTGFAPRAKNLTLYVMSGFEGHDDLLARLGPHSTGASCLYLTSLDRIDRPVLREIVERSVAHMRATND